MKKIIAVFFFLLLACSQEKQDDAREELPKITPADWIFLDGSNSWGDALNACPAGYHLPDQFEWEKYIACNADVPDNKGVYFDVY